MKVRVERIRRGRRMPEVDYVEANRPRKRGPNGFADAAAQEAEMDQSFREGSSRLRLPWRINTDQG